MSERPRVLCYAPYNRWALHGMWEMTILQGLRQAGADVRYVLCDGLYTDCDVFWDAVEPRPANACVSCQADVTRRVADLGLDYRWLGRHLAPEEPREARRWARELPADALVEASYGDWNVGRWVIGSVHSHFRRSKLDVTDPKVEKVMRSYLYSGLVACFALDRLLEDSRPDVLLLFSGRLSSTRVALELARRRGIRVVCHERGPRVDTLQLSENSSALAFDTLRAYWEAWGDVPLAADELDAMGTHLAERERGIGLSWKPLSPPPLGPDVLRAALGLAPGRPLWALFTSSDDEVVADTDWRGTFPSQYAWIERTIAYAGRHPELDLVIRVHPNTGSKRSHGTNRDQLEALARLFERLPPNVHVIDADEELSSYEVMDLASVGLVYHSTVGLELACKGKATVVAAGNFIWGMPFAHTVARAEDYEGQLDALLPLPPEAVDPEVARLAWRLAYGYFFRLAVDFPLVRMTNPVFGQPTWRSPSHLAPGADAGLDRCVGLVLGTRPVCDPPSEAERARSDADERAYFALDAPARAFAAVAFADELIADASLLAAWGHAFGAGDAATLVIQTPADATEALIAAVGSAGLDGEDAPDLLAVDASVGELGPVQAVFSRREQAGPLATTPRFDDAALPALRALACGG